MKGVRLIRNKGIGQISHIEYKLQHDFTSVYYNKLSDKFDNNNLTHDIFQKWLIPNSQYISNNANNNKNIIIKPHTSLLTGDWRDTIEYGGGKATAVGFHWWGFLFKYTKGTFSKGR